MQKTGTAVGFGRKSFKEKYIGDKAFYRTVLRITIPIMIQNFISNFVNMLDNIMVGSVGTEPMSGVAIANQLFFVYALAIFGGLSGVGIYTAQFFGKGDCEGVRYSVRYKFLLALILTGSAVALLYFCGPFFLNFFLTDDGSGANLTAVLGYGYEYLKIILISLPAFALIQVYSSTLRECGETVVPMVAGLVSVGVNILLNYLLIFGKLGLPALGVNGAAIATVIARYIECGIVMIWSHRHKERNSWIVGLYRSMRIPLAQLRVFIRKGAPILINECLWSLGMTTLVQIYSMSGITVVAAMNISNTINNTMAILFTTMGNVVAIMVGQLLGAGELERAKDEDNKLIFFTLCLSVVAGILLVLTSTFFPLLYNTTEEVRALASEFMIIYAIFCPSVAFMNAAYFTIRSGGKTFITFLFDSVSIWGVSILAVYLLSRFTGLSATELYIAEHVANLFKVLIGYILLRKNIWVVNLVKDPVEAS